MFSSFMPPFIGGERRKVIRNLTKRNRSFLLLAICLCLKLNFLPTNLDAKSFSSVENLQKSLKRERER